jgi:hypothetical protein
MAIMVDKHNADAAAKRLVRRGLRTFAVLARLLVSVRSGPVEQLAQLALVDTVRFHNRADYRIGHEIVERKIGLIASLSAHGFLPWRTSWFATSIGRSHQRACV